MSKTKLKDVFLKAAQLVDESAERTRYFFVVKGYACDDIGVDDRVRGKADAIMETYYPPDDGTREIKEHMPSEPRDVRVLAFCFLAAIAEAEGL